MVKEIPLTKGKFTIVDDADYEDLAQFKWRYGSNGYAERHSKIGGKRIVISVHRQLMNPPIDMKVDHINGDPLDNRRDNLRICTHKQNLCNRGPDKTGKHPRYKGVSFRTDMRSKPWYAQIEADGKKRYIGYYETEVEAARAYNEAALRFHGEYARLNTLPQD